MQGLSARNAKSRYWKSMQWGKPLKPCTIQFNSGGKTVTLNATTTPVCTPPQLHRMSQHDIGCELEALAQAYSLCLEGVGRREGHTQNIEWLHEIARWFK